MSASTDNNIDYGAKILLDSVNPVGDRLTTFELTYPRFVHAELMTHRLFSRNSASSRAIPTEQLISRVTRHPVLPKWWGKNQSGMQAREQLEGKALSEVMHTWLDARNVAVAYVKELHRLGLHKQIANRIIEPWMFITVIVSATEYDNWFHLRDDPDAQPEIAWVAHEMRQLYVAGEPTELDVGEWHLPMIHDHERELSPDLLRKISVARCARVSYLTHDGKRDYEEDVALHDRLVGNGHWSPFEHVAEADGTHSRHGNFIGWRQYRKLFRQEHYGKRMP